MPNYCINSLAITGTQKDLEDFQNNIKVNDKGDPEIIETYWPRPENIGDDWCEWSLENWGSKWSDCFTEQLTQANEGYLQYNFQSAWSPPIQAITNISTLFPDLVFVMSWIEESMWFYGAMAARNGENVVMDAELEDLEGYDPDDEEGNSSIAVYEAVDALEQQCLDMIGETV